MLARRNPDGSYLLEGTNLENFHARGRIVALGGRWHPKWSVWEVPESALEPLQVERVYGVVRESYCHMPPGFAWATQREVDTGQFVQNLFCIFCHSHSAERAAIIEVCGEADVARSVYDAEFRARVEALA